IAERKARKASICASRLAAMTKLSSSSSCGRTVASNAPRYRTIASMLSPNIEMDSRPIVGVPDLADAPDDPLRIGDQFLAFETDIALDLLKRGVRQQLDPLQDHAVDH